MTKKTNKDPIGKDELLKRLESGNDEALEDFEKEALEGFASLENTALSDRLMKDLDKRIDETYAGKDSGRSRWVWYSIAAGLILVVTLSILFVNNFEKEEKLAYVQPKENTGATTESSVPSREINMNEKPVTAAQTAPVDEPAKKEKETVTRGTGVAEQKEARISEPVNERQADEISNAASGAPAGPKVTVPDQQPAKDLDKVVTVNDAYSDRADAKGKKQKSDAGYSDDRTDLATNTKSRPLKEESEKKPMEKSRKKAEDVPMAGFASAETSTTADYKNSPAPSANKSADNSSGVSAKNMEERNSIHSENATGGTGSTASLQRTPYFKTGKFANHEDYLRSEIDKNEKLRTDLADYGKAFRIELEIGEKGKVLNAKADLPASCSGCREAIEKILMSMPLWEPAQNSNGKAVKQSFFFSYKY